MENIQKSFQTLSQKLNLTQFQKFFLSKTCINPSIITTWNDFVFLNFLSIETLLNQAEEVKKFKASDFKLKINSNNIYVKLA